MGGLGKGGLEHFVGLYKQPEFTDGNGRVARMLRNLLLGTYRTGSGSSKRFSNSWKGWSLAAPPQNLEQWLPNHSCQVRALHYTLHPTLARRGLRRSRTIISCAPYSNLIPVSPLAQAAPLAAALEIGSRAGAAADAQVRDAPLEPAALRAAACEERARLSLARHLGC